VAKIDLTGLPMAITGASSGIGAATALACARAGMPVALGARRADRLAEVAARVRALGGRAVTVEMDVTDPDGGERLARACVESFGSVYGLFANAGIGIEAPFHEMTDAQVRRIFEVNFFGSLSAVRAALPSMLSAGRGHVLFCSSCLAQMGIPYYGMYCATKASQHLVGRAMRLELAPKGVHVSTVHPVGTVTEFFDKTKNAAGGEPALVSRAPSWTMQRPERVADAVVRCLRKPRSEVWTSAFTRLAMAFASAFPGIENPVLATMVRKRLAENARKGQAAPPHA
jgi:short-subunit dehydrogenase